MCPFERCNWTSKQQDILKTWSALARHSTACESLSPGNYKSKWCIYLAELSEGLIYTLCFQKRFRHMFFFFSQTIMWMKDCQLTLAMLLCESKTTQKAIQNCTLCLPKKDTTVHLLLCCSCSKAIWYSWYLLNVLPCSTESNLEPGPQSRPSMEVYLWVIYRSSVHVRTTTSGLRQTD